MTITTRVEVAIGHRLWQYVGKCAHLHGHNYQVSVTLSGEPNALGMVVDFSDVKKALKEILAPFDHAMVLHQDDPFVPLLKQEHAKLVTLTENPTAENFASLFFSLLSERFPEQVERVKVQETEDGWATVDTLYSAHNVRMVIS